MNRGTEIHLNDYLYHYFLVLPLLVRGIGAHRRVIGTFRGTQMQRSFALTHEKFKCEQVFSTHSHTRQQRQQLLRTTYESSREERKA